MWFINANVRNSEKIHVVRFKASFAMVKKQNHSHTTLCIPFLHFTVFHLWLKDNRGCFLPADEGLSLKTIWQWRGKYMVCTSSFSSLTPTGAAWGVRCWLPPWLRPDVVWSRTRRPVTTSCLCVTQDWYGTKQKWTLDLLIPSTFVYLNNQDTLAKPIIILKSDRKDQQVCLLFIYSRLLFFSGGITKKSKIVLEIIHNYV